MAEYDSDEEILYKAGPLPTGWSDYFKTDNVHFNQVDNTIRQSFYRLQFYLKRLMTYFYVQVCNFYCIEILAVHPNRVFYSV